MLTSGCNVRIPKNLECCGNTSNFPVTNGANTEVTCWLAISLNFTHDLTNMPLSNILRFSRHITYVGKSDFNTKEKCTIDKLFTVAALKLNQGVTTTKLRYFYKIEKNSQKMIKVGEYIVSTVYTEDCSWRNGNYAFLAYSLEGVVNSIAVTENYIIYWMFQSTFNPCTILKRPDAFPTVPLLDNFDFDSSGILEIVVISKSDETVIIFEDSPLQQFTGHVVQMLFYGLQVNAMETGSDENLQLTMDLITHPLKNYYDTFDMDFMRNHQIINIFPFCTACSLPQLKQSCSQLTKQFVPLSLPTGYMKVNCSTWMIRYILEPSAMYLSRITLHDPVDEFFVIKDHEVTNVLSWKPREANLLPYGMTFLKHPESRFEDDGVLLLTATVTNEEKKSVLIVLNATTMEEIGRSVLPVTAPFGYRAMFIYSSSSSAMYSVFNFYTTILVTLCWFMSVVVPTLPSVQQGMIIGQKLMYPQ
ncbi:beta,beta-carotene 9,10-dioxygenase 2 [Trichinella spiralis]|uniref:beta,beta-carotene 9,10-dioxygenase 2 n=1 Tax=Trichinella spiralis TaxID=6334 RepID=UPI0001EFC1C9|nr:beta,beta-carotene 9,10-dioxygenase 2 [Trichinella spiralis]